MPSSPPIAQAGLQPEWESYLSFLNDHELLDVYDDAPINRLLAENKSRSAPRPTHSPGATVTPLPTATRVNALRPETLRHFDLEQAVQAATAFAAAAMSPEALYAALEAFVDIPLRYEGGRGLIRGRGSVPAALVVVGDTPDTDEDEALSAFAGKTGHLTDIALRALGVEERVCRLPGLFWRPAGGRPPTEEDIRLTAPFMRRLIELLEPRAVLLCGTTATRIVLDSGDGVPKLRGRAHEMPSKEGRSPPVFVTFPPGLWLRQPMAKKAFWSDCLLATEGM